MPTHGSCFTLLNNSVLSQTMMGLFWNPRRCLRNLSICHYRGILIFTAIVGGLLESQPLSGQYMGAPSQEFRYFLSLLGISWNLCREFVITCHCRAIYGYLPIIGSSISYHCREYLGICAVVWITYEYAIIGTLVVFCHY